MTDFILKSILHIQLGFLTGVIVMVFAIALKDKIPILKRWFDKYDD